LNFIVKGWRRYCQTWSTTSGLLSGTFSYTYIIFFFKKNTFAKTERVGQSPAERQREEIMRKLNARELKVSCSSSLFDEIIIINFVNFFKVLAKLKRSHRNALEKQKKEWKKVCVYIYIFHNSCVYFRFFIFFRSTKVEKEL
jgi:hypothetical protein